MPATPAPKPATVHTALHNARPIPRPYDPVRAVAVLTTYLLLGCAAAAILWLTIWGAAAMAYALQG